MVNILQISQFLMNSDKISLNSDRIVDRILSRKVRMVRSLGDRTFQPRSRPACPCSPRRSSRRSRARGRWSACPTRASSTRPAAATTRPLVEKFDTELFSDFSAKSSNFRRLVLGCINADFCVQILILQRFSRSTRFSNLCTARNSTSSQIFAKLFHIFAEIYVKIAIFSTIFIEFCTHFNENFSEFR